MKKIILAALIFVTVQAYAQYPKGMPAAMKNSGHLYGKITAVDGKPIEGASVLLLHQQMDTATKKMKMLLLTGVMTKNNGDFNFTGVPVMGKLQLRVSNSGFKTLIQDVSFKPGAGFSTDKDLGNLKLETDTKVLAGVTIVGSAPALKMDIDKKVFNVEKNIVSAG
jgi:ferric enterobactin receptor